MGWISILQLILKLTPYVVAGVQTLHPTASGTTKKQIAGDLLNVAVAGATSVLSPDNAAIAQVIGGAASQIIDATVAVHKAAGTPGFTSNAPALSTGAVQAGTSNPTLVPPTQIPGSMPPA